MEDYIPLIIPLTKPIEELSKEEATEYFDWFVRNIDSRVDYLMEKVAIESKIPKEKLCFSSEALILIWQWFLRKAKISKTPQKVLRELKRNMNNVPKSFVQHIINQNKEEFSVCTKYILRDIGMYLGKMFVTNYPVLYWSFKTTPKNYAYVNQPLLKGFVDNDPSYPKPFDYELETIEAVECLALNLYDGTQNDSDLLDLYESMLPLIPGKKEGNI